MKKLLVLPSLLCALFAFALDATHFTVQRVTSPYFVVDGNSPSSGPQSAYVGFKITNTSATTYNNLKFSITSLSTSVAGQNYSLVSPSSGITLAGTLAPGESKVCYYFVAYPANVTPQATFNYSLSDATTSSKTGSFVIFNRSCISANAGGLATQNLTNQDLIGGIVYDDVTYTLGNIRNGDETDFQISVSTQFDPNKLTLLKTEVIASTVPGITAGTQNLLYFGTTANQSTGTVTIRWTFKISSFNFTVLILPYAGATSGSSNYKYAIDTDLGGGTPITVSSAANPLMISKTSDKTLYGTNTTALFTVTIQNPATFPVSIDKITDQIPAGFTFQSLHAASQVNSANSTTIPSSGASGTITLEGGVVSGSTTSYVVPAGGSIILKYTATAPSSPASNLLTMARGFVGTTQFDSADNTVNVSATLPVHVQSFTAGFAGGNVKLNWVTSGEANSSHFDIERSSNGIAFSKIGSIAAYNNSTRLNNYSFIDSLPGTGKLYYRLRATDKDGQYNYTTVVSLSAPLKNVSVTAAPNPFVNYLQVTIASKEKEAHSLQLLNSAGQPVWEESGTFEKGINTILISPLGSLKSGVFFLRLSTRTETSVFRLIKE